MTSHSPPAQENTCTCDAPDSPPVYAVLADHQQSDPAWEFSRLLQWLHLWKDRFISEFKLEVSQISLSVERLSWSRLGHFRYGHNGFGLVGEIAINRRYLSLREPHEHLGTLLHELLHAWQQVHGKPGKGNYHNLQFRRKAASYGLIVDQRGYTQYEPGSPFFELLARYGEPFPDLPTQPVSTRGSRTRLHKWSCSCTPPVNVRVAISDFQARCLKCQQLFARAQ